MKKMNHASRLAAALAGLLMAAGAAHAQTPQTTSATYDDWIVQCVNEAGPPAKKTCQMFQMTQAQGKNVSLSRTSLDKPVAGKPARLTVQLPVNVSLRAPVVIHTDDADPGLSAPFDRCAPAGCFADFEIKDDPLKKFRASEGAGKITFKDFGGRDATLPLSFKGFRAAYDALLKE